MNPRELVFYGVFRIAKRRCDDWHLQQPSLPTMHVHHGILTPPLTSFSQSELGYNGCFVSTKSANQLPQKPEETNDAFATLRATTRGAERTLLLIERAALINSIVPHACLIAAVNAHTQQARF